MRTNVKRMLACVLAVALLVSCAVSGLVLPTAADEPAPVIYFEKGIITVPAQFDSEYDIAAQLKAVDGYTINAGNLQWSIADNKAKRYSTNSAPYSGAQFEAVTLNGSKVVIAESTTANSLSSQNKSGNWSFGHVNPTITVTDGVNTATAKIRWEYEKVPLYYDFENGQRLQHSASHKLNNYITEDTEGNYALRIPTNERIPTRAFLYPAFAPNSVYKVSYKYKNEGTGKGTRMFTLNDQYDMTMSPKTLVTDASTSGWQTVEATVTTGAAPTINYHYAFFFDRGAAGTNYVWMDDVKIELVSSPATDIVVKPEAPSMYKGSAKTFTVVSEPEGASAGSITWSVSDSTKASVDPVSGIVTALADSGTVEVIATSSYGLTDSTTVTLLPEKVVDPAVVFEADFEEKLSAHWAPLVKGDEYFTVIEEAGNVSNHVLQMTPATSGRRFSNLNLIPGRTYKLSFKAKGEGLTVYVTGGQATPSGWHYFVPDDPDVWQEFELYLSVPYLLIHGSTNDVFAFRNDKTGNMYVDDVELRLVEADPPAEAIEFDYTRLNMKPGRVRDLQILADPEKCDLSELVWTSSNEDVAYVTPGQVVAVGAGTATVTATTKNGKVATAYITVTEHAAFIDDAMFEDAESGWVTDGGAEKEAEKGYYYTTAMKLPAGSSISHTLKGLKANTPYQLAVWQSSVNNRSVAKVTVTNGETVVYEGMLGKKIAWERNLLEFTTGDISGDCTLTITNTSTNAKDTVYVDNVVLGEVVSDIDPNILVSSDFEDTLSDKWSEFNKKNDQYTAVIKDPADASNHVLELQPFYDAQGGDVSGRWFKNIDNLIPGRSYKISFKVKGPGLDIYCQPGRFAEYGTYRALGWENVKSKDPSEWYTYEGVWVVDPQAIHIDAQYVFALKNQGDVVTLVDDFEVRLLEPDVPVSSMEFNFTEISVAPGRTQALKLVGTPSTADLSGLTWTSSNEQVAYVIPGQVSPAGSGLEARVTAVGSGEAIITATANNGKTATCKVTVNAHEAILKDTTLNNDAATEWVFEEGAAKTEGVGHYYTTGITLPKDGVVSQSFGGLKPNSRYQVYLSTSCKTSGAKNKITVKVIAGDGVTEVLSDVTATTASWSINKFEFATGEEVTGDYKLVITNETADGSHIVYLDNIIVAEALSDADLIVSDFYWNNDPGFIGQVKPGTPLTFTVAVVNQGTEAVRANQTFDIDILMDTKKIQTISYTGAIEPGALITVTGTAPWNAVAGDHMLTAHANASMKLLENNIDNNDLTYNLRVANDILVAPEGALKRGFSKLTFADDFNSLDTIDTKATGNEGYHWYVTRLYGESDQVLGEDYVLENGVLTLQSRKSSWAYSISTVDTRKTSGFYYNQGYLEARFRLPYTSSNTDRLYGIDQSMGAVRNPGIWAFDIETMWADITGERNQVGIETDWLEFKGDKYKNPKTGKRESRFDISLHHREHLDDDGVQDYWAAEGTDFYYSDGYVASGATANDMGEWHTMGWAWSENLIEVYLDGKLIHVKRYSEDSFPSLDTNVNTGTALREGTFSPLNTQYNNIILGAQEEFKMEVDYIRVWQYDGTVEPEEDVPGNTGNTSAFIGEYLTDANGIVTEPTLDNYEQILAGESAFATLTEAEQAAVNAAIGRDYRELVAEIYNTISAVDNFVAFYACAEDGTPYTLVDATNYEWIASSAAEWETFSDFARALVDVKVAEQSGMTFTDMLAQAQAYTPEAPKQDEVTTAKKKVVKTDLTVLWIVLGVVGGVIVVGGAVVAVLLFTKKKKAK